MSKKIPELLLVLPFRLADNGFGLAAKAVIGGFGIKDGRLKALNAHF